MEERQLNEKESLELISQMIRNTQQRFQKVNAVPFLVFGYITVTLSIVIWYLLKVTSNGYWNLLWFSIPLLGYLGMKIFFPNRKKIARTYVDKAVDSVWMVCGVTMILMSLATFFVNFPILFEIIVLIGVAITITGLITKMQFLVITGVLNILSSGLIIFGVVEGINQILLFGALFFIFMVLPGHILYAKKRN